MPTDFCWKGFPVTQGEIPGLCDTLLYAKYPLKAGKIQEKLIRETLVSVTIEVSTPLQLTSIKSNIFRRQGFKIYIFGIQFSF